MQGRNALIGNQGGDQNESGVASARADLSRWRCASCKAPLTKRGARCRACGWAVDYSPETSRRMAAVIVGVILTLAVIFAIGFSIHIAYAERLANG